MRNIAVILYSLFFYFWYIYNDGSYYVGDWKDGKREGYGIKYYIDGTVYKGQWRNDNKHGQGSITYLNGVKFIGQWENNKLKE